jgi:hypothetical protein
MNIPQSTIQPFEPHGMPKLRFQKTWSEDTLKIILDVMDALDKFIKDDADNCFALTSMLEEFQLRALGEHLCGWLEETAMKAGADIVKAKCHAIYAISGMIDEIGIPKEFLSPAIKEKSKLIGFMYMVDFTVNDEDVNHLLDYKFKRDPQ